MDREITLRDYGRVLWSGRWIILATTAIAAIVGLLLSFASTTRYTATAELFLGQATTVSGVPVSTPATNPATAPTVLTGDTLVERVARQIGVSPQRVRDGVSLTAPRAPGGSVGNQPTVATITFVDEDREVARDGANAYAEAVLAESREIFRGVVGTYQQAAARAGGRRAAAGRARALPSPARGRGRHRSRARPAVAPLQRQPAALGGADRAVHPGAEPGQGAPDRAARHHLARPQPGLVGEPAEPGPHHGPGGGDRPAGGRHRDLRVARQPGRPCGARVAPGPG
ncbi:MAG: hypothetical protein K2X91_09255, partial [Thermoleophilia bacterium]|nr:hypothetical protein [Thermoleophilia bacterium]